MTPSHQPPTDARVLVDQLLDDAVKRRASDVHLEPTADGLEVRFRIDGLLETVATHHLTTGRSLVTRLIDRLESWACRACICRSCFASYGILLSSIAPRLLKDVR